MQLMGEKGAYKIWQVEALQNNKTWKEQIP